MLSLKEDLQKEVICYFFFFYNCGLRQTYAIVVIYTFC